MTGYWGVGGGGVNRFLEFSRNQIWNREMTMSHKILLVIFKAGRDYTRAFLNSSPRLPSPFRESTLRRNRFLTKVLEFQNNLWGLETE
jgi:hypothetical protein